MENTLATLVAMPTMYEDTVANNAAVSYVADWFAARGMHIDLREIDGRSALIATTKPQSSQPKAMLYGHIDVMTAHEQAFTMLTEENKLIGRGVYDMKFAIATYMHAIDELKGRLEDYDFSIVIVADEEYGSRDNKSSIKRLVADGLRADIVLLPDGGKDWDVETLAKGHWRLALIANGKSAHASRPWEGDSASFKLIQALHEIRLHFEGHGPSTDTLNIGNIHGNGTFNQIPSQMEALVEVRLVHEDSLAKNQKLFQTICDKYGITVQTRGISPPVRQDLSYPLIQQYIEAVDEVTGRRPAPCISNGGSDAVYFKDAGMSCIVTYLPGGGHHGDNEWVDRQSYHQFLPVVLNYLDRVARIA